MKMKYVFKKQSEKLYPWFAWYPKKILCMDVNTFKPEGVKIIFWEWMVRRGYYLTEKKKWIWTYYELKDSFGDIEDERLSDKARELRDRLYPKDDLDALDAGN